MTDYKIIYQAHNDYENPVSEAIFEFLITPCDDETQLIKSQKITNSLNESIFYSDNLFGFRLARVRTSKPFDKFSIRLEANVKKMVVPAPPKEHTIAEEKELLRNIDFRIDNQLYLTSGGYIRIFERHKPDILMFDGNKYVHEFLTELNDYLANLITFEVDSTHVHTTADEVIDLKKGVCQDFAHVYITMCRYNNIPCRYVSGYLDQGSNFNGSSVMHAWVEAYSPIYGWMGFDPANKQLVDSHYIKVAHGTDYSDCSPMKGVLRTSGQHRIKYEVKVACQ